MKKILENETGKGTVKFMQVLNQRVYRNMAKEGKKRGIGVQEFVRAIMIPEWIWFDQRRQAWLDSKKPVRRAGKRNSKRMEPGHDLQKKDPDVPPSTGT